ncbi:MAG: heparinase II/III family protein [Candidatus Sumerlaeota bacterium]|nr:heparinase II/III family protein [Candidatus Sumerlaeota bacterium]
MMKRSSMTPKTALKSLAIILFMSIHPSLLSAAETSKTAQVNSVDLARIQAIAGKLSEQPAGFGRPITDRAAWQSLGKHPAFQEAVAKAEALLREPMPPMTDDLYLDYSRTGVRRNWESVSGKRRGRVATLVIAECLEDKGRFLPAFKDVVRSLCADATWVMPAHDGKLENFRKKSVDIDLGSSDLAWNLATACYLLGERLDKETQSLIRENIQKRILDPYSDMVNGKREKNWWMTGTNNWNSVCLAQVTGSALALLQPREERAFYIAAAELYSKYFLSGFTPDGYCSEGLGYWCYGFGHYVLLSEAIAQATGGEVDLMKPKMARAAALFGARIEIINSVYPAFADCAVGTRPSPRIMYFVSHRYGLELAEWEKKDPTGAEGGLYGSMMYSFPNTASRLAALPPEKRKSAAAADEGQTGDGAALSQGLPLRDWLEQGGVLICRPEASKRSAPRVLAVALKGGHNAEHHNHNDVGSYVVVAGDKNMLVDPGAEVYTARTFSSRRYESKALNSFGHPVPIVAGRLQQPGAQARGRIVRAEFTDSQDTLVLDIRSAYNVPELKSLERTFVYSRTGDGSLAVTDAVEFSSPQTFETALITFGQWKQTAPQTLMVTYENKSVRVDIDSADAAFEIIADQIKEDMRTKTLPTRIGIRLKDKTAKAKIFLQIRSE